MITRESLINDTTKLIAHTLYAYKEVVDTTSDLYIREEVRAKEVLDDLIYICQLRSAFCEYKTPTFRMSTQFLDLFYAACVLVQGISWYEGEFNYTYDDLYDDAKLVVEDAFDIADDRFLLDTDLSHDSEAITARERIDELMEKLKDSYGEYLISLEN